MAEPQTSDDVRAKLGIMPTAYSPVWLITISRAFLNALPDDQQRLRVVVDNGTMKFCFGRNGAKIFRGPGHPTTVSVQVGPVNANMLPKGKNTRHPSVEIKGIFDPTTLEFQFAVPAFVKDIGMVPVPIPTIPAPVQLQAKTRSPVSLQAKTRSKWPDHEVRSLINRLRDCLKHRPDLVVEIKNDELKVTRTMTITF